MSGQYALLSPLFLATRCSMPTGAAVPGPSAAAAQQNQSPEPIEGKNGGTILGPRNVPLEQQSPDTVTPETDKGAIPNLRFSRSNAHLKMRDGGWSREVSQRELPIATTTAGVNMRLDPAPLARDIVEEPSGMRPRLPFEPRVGEEHTGLGLMDKVLPNILNFIKGPLLVVLMASVVVSLVRRRPRRLTPPPARVRRVLPPA